MQVPEDVGLELSHGQLLEVIFKLFRADSSSRKSLIRSRFKNLQKAGLPKRAKPARGSHKKYDFYQVCEFVLAFELSEFGISPKAILDNFFLDIDSFYVAKALYKACLDPALEGSNDIYLAFLPKEISGSSEYLLYESMYELGKADDVAYLADRSRRSCIVNLRRLGTAMLSNYPQASLDAACMERPMLLGGLL